MKRFARFLLAVALVIGAGCASQSQGENTTGEKEVAIQGFAYAPADLTVSVGDTVTWTNLDSVPHTVTSGAPGSETGVFDSGRMDNGQTFSYTFTNAGKFDYFCTYHPNMRATVTVT